LSTILIKFMLGLPIELRGNDIGDFHEKIHKFIAIPANDGWIRPTLCYS